MNDFVVIYGSAPLFAEKMLPDWFFPGDVDVFHGTGISPEVATAIAEEWAECYDLDTMPMDVSAISLMKDAVYIPVFNQNQRAILLQGDVPIKFRMVDSWTSSLRALADQPDACAARLCEYAQQPEGLSINLTTSRIHDWLPMYSGVKCLTTTRDRIGSQRFNDLCDALPFGEVLKQLCDDEMRKILVYWCHPRFKDGDTVDVEIHLDKNDIQPTRMYLRSQVTGEVSQLVKLSNGTSRPTLDNLL